MPANRSRSLRLEPLETRAVPTFYGNSLFPADNPWNQNISAAPVASNSDAIIGRILGRFADRRVRADFGNPAADNALYGIPVNVVDSTVAKVPVYIPPFGYPAESDPVQVPIPPGAVIEGDGATGPAPSTSRFDSHLLVYDKTANVLYELFMAVRPTETQFPYNAGPNPSGQWGATQVSYWDLNTNYFRTVGATSADAAGLPILPGLVRPDEALPAAQGGQGRIDHAIRVTVQQTRNDFIFPASHRASGLTGSDLPRMGERFRLKSSFVIPADWSAEARAIATAMKEYGLIVADNGSDLFFQGTPSTQWNMSSVQQVRAIRASDLEVVDLSPAVTGLSVTSGPAGGGTAVTVSGRNFSGAAGRLGVQFGGTDATSVTILSDSKLVAVAPAGAAGTVDVRVRSGGLRPNVNGQQVFFGYGTSPATPAARYTFTAAAAGVTVTPTAGLTTTEGGGTAAFTVSLSAAPTATVSIPVAVSRPTEATASTAVVTFTPGDWNTPRTVVLTGVDDSVFDGPVGYTVTLGAATSADPAYQGLDPADVSAVNQDNDPAPAVLGVAVNPGGPVPAQRSRVTSLQVTFNGTVAVAAGAFTLTRQEDGAAITDGGAAPQVAVATSVVGGRTVATLTFVGAGGRVDWGSLADGVWVLRVDRTRVTAPGGGMTADYATPSSGAGRLHRLAGDVTGDGTVNADDLTVLASAFGTAVGDPGYTSPLDLNGDGVVNADDLAEFASRFGVSV